MYRILVSDKLGQAGLDRLEAAEDTVYEMKTGLSKDELLAIMPEYDALIVRSGTKVDEDVLRAGTNLKVVGRAGMGVDNIDLRAATLAGIIVMNTPGANSTATAEQAMALMLGVSRHLAEAHSSLAGGEWKRSMFTGTELMGKTLGIVGFGRVGRLVSQRALAFGMNVLAYDPFVSEEVAAELDVTLVDLDDLLAESDYITLHTALLEETEEMVNKKTIAMMKDGVVIINAARGKLINDHDLAAALKSGKVKAAGIDVYRQEPPLEDNPLLSAPNVLHTPHLGASTVEAQRVVAEMIVDQVLDALRGTDFLNTLNMPFRVGGGGFAEIRPFMELAEKLGKLHKSLADGPITRVEVEVQGDTVTELVRAIAAGILKGLVDDTVDFPINYINAPVVAAESGIEITQTKGIKALDYPNLITCRAEWDGGEQVLSGVLFGGSEPRIVQVDDYQLDARPEGVVLIMGNRDVPGVIGRVGTLMAKYNVNIGEWRLGRDHPGGEALSFINLDSEPPQEVLDELAGAEGVTVMHLVTL
ncbi:MAG: phosphoglycerate dehydrogenase [Candidatus Promineifilaceae bacterium]|jgi:D-3-phosphoglycerate dehydrogenase